MKRAFSPLMAVSSSIAFLSSCSSPNTVPKNYSSLKQAELACDAWKKKGGNWKMSIKDFSITSSDQSESQEFPIKLRGNNNQKKEDLTNSENKDELTVFMPLFSSNSKKIRNNQEIVIRTAGEDKWIDYSRRICRIDTNKNNLILGEEYQIHKDGKILDTEIPKLKVEKEFPF